VVFLHGDPGMTSKELTFAASFVRDGFVAFAACWYKTRGRYAGQVGQPSSVFDCADAPEWVGNRIEAPDASLEAPTIASIVDAVRRLPGIRPGSVAVMGHSAGAHAAMEMASTGGRVEAVVSLAGGFDPGRRTRTGPLGGVRADLTPLVAGLRAPLLIVHGTADTTAPVSEARAYEAAARANGKAVESIYVEGGSHTFLYVLSDEVRGQIIGFLKAQLLR
jgi:dienelactone hydrolase